MKIFTSSRCGRRVGWVGRLVRLLCSVLLPEGRGQEKVTKSLVFRKRWQSHCFFQEKWKNKENLHLYLCAHVTSLFQVEVLWQSRATRLWSLLWRWVRLLSSLSHHSIFGFWWLSILSHHSIFSFCLRALTISLYSIFSLCQVLAVTGTLSTARGRQRGPTKTVG